MVQRATEVMLCETTAFILINAQDRVQIYFIVVMHVRYNVTHSGNI